MQLSLNILPDGQKQLWQELGSTPEYFTLYGGTALALRLGHRESVDFDFFTSNSFQADTLYREITYLQNSEVVQLEKNTLTCSLVRNNKPVKVSFFGGLSILANPIQVADKLSNPKIQIASFPDLVATKMLVIQHRSEKKDYLDISEILTLITLSQAISFAKQLYGSVFNPFITLKALTYFEDGDLVELPQSTKEFLQKTLQKADITQYE